MFPRNVLLEWDPNPSVDGVIRYEVTLNGALVGSPTGTSQVVALPAEGTYTLGVAAVNLWVKSAEAQVVLVAVSPGVPTNVHFTVV